MFKYFGKKSYVLICVKAYMGFQHNLIDDTAFTKNISITKTPAGSAYPVTSLM